MRSVVVYESAAGSTRDVAAAVGAGLERYGPVDLVTAGDAPLTLRPRVGLLVVGASTHAFSVRRREAHHDPLGADDYGALEWLAALHPCRSSDVRAATFDTRPGRAHVVGSATMGVRRELRRHGFAMLDRPHTFWVADDGLPTARELLKAQAWGVVLGRRATAVAAVGARTPAAAQP